MASKKNQSTIGEEVAPIAIHVTGPMTRSPTRFGTATDDHTGFLKE